MKISRFALALASLAPLAVHAQQAPDEGDTQPAIIVVGQGLADLAEARAVELGGDAEKIAKGRGAKEDF